MAIISFKVTGMHCRSCKKLVESVLSDLPGVESVEVDKKTGLGTLRHDGQADYGQLASVVAELKDYKTEPL